MSISARFMCELDSDIQKLASDHRCTKRHILSIIESFKSVTKIDESDLPTLHICFCKLWKILLEYSKHNEDSVELIRKTNDVILNVTDRFSIYNSLVTNSINLLKLIIEYSLIGCDSVKELLPVFNIWLSRCSNDCISQFAEQHKGTISKLYDLVENGDVHQQFLVLEAVWRIYHKSKHFHLERIIPPNLFEVLRGATENHLHRDLRRFITLKNEDLSDSVFSMKCEGITYNFYELQGVPDGGFKENDIWVDFHLFLGNITIICDRNSLIQSHYPIPLCEFEALTFYSKDIQTFQYQRKRFTNCHKFVFKIGLLENKTNLFPGDKPSPELLSLKIVAKMSGEQDSNLQSNIIPKMFGRFLKTKKVGQSIDHFLKEPDENVPSTSILKKTSRFMDDVSFSNREDQLPQPSVASMEKRSVTAVVDSLKSTGLISKSISPISFATNMLQDVMDEDEDQASSSESSEVLATTIEGLFRKNSEKIGPVQATIDLTKDSLEYAMNNTTNSEMSQMDKVERWLRNSESQKKVLNEIVPNNKRIQTFVILSDEEECSDEEEYEEPLQKTSLAKRSLLQKSREEISNSKESPNLPINSKRSSSITVVNRQCSKIKKSTGISTNKRNLSIINESIMRETAELSANDRYSSPTSANEQNAGDESRIADDEDRSPCPVIINDNDKEKPVMQESAEFRKNATDDEDGSVINKNFEPPMQEPAMQESIGNTRSDKIVPSSVSPVVIDEEPIIQEVTGSVINKNFEPPIQEPIMQESTGNTKSDKFVPPSVSPVVIDEEPIIQEVTGSVMNKNFEPPMQEPIMQESIGNTRSDKIVPSSVSPVVIDEEPIIQEVTGSVINKNFEPPIQEPIMQESTGNTKSDKFVPPSVSPVVIDEEPIIQEVTGSVMNKNFEPPMQEPIMQESTGNTKSDKFVPPSVSPVVIDEEPIIQEVTGSVINKNFEPPIQEPIMQESTGNTKSDKFVPPSVSPVVIDEEPIIQEVTGSVMNKNFEPPMQEPIMQESTGNTKSDKFVPPSVSPVVIDKEPIIQEVTGLPQNDKYISPVLTDEEEPIIQKSTETPTSLAIGKIDVADQYESDDDLPLSLWIEKRNKRCSKQNVKSETTSKPKRKGPQLKLKMPQKVPKNKRKDAVEVNKPNKFMGTITDMMEEHDRHLSMKRAEVDAGKTGNDNEDVSVRMRKRKLYDPKDISYLSEMDCAGYAEPQVPATEIITIKDTPKRRKKSQSPRRNNGGVSESDWEYFRSVIRERKMNKKDKVQNTGFDETCVDKHVAKENGFIFKDLTELRNSPIENKRRKMPKYHEGTSGELEDHSKGTSGSNKVKILENNLIRGPNTCINNNEHECSCHEKLRLIKQIIGSGCCCEFN